MLQEIRGTGAPEEAYTDGIFWELTTELHNGNPGIYGDILEIYDEFFLHGDSDNWRRGVFHYGIVVYSLGISMAFSGDVPPYWGYSGATNSFVISKPGPDWYYEKLNGRKSYAYIWAANFMHEMGHNFGIRFGRPFGCDNRLASKPWMPAYYRFWNYKSIMNYRYVHAILDYSDGTHGRGDYDDWGKIDLSYFEKSSATVIRQRAAGGNDTFDSIPHTSYRI